MRVPRRPTAAISPSASTAGSSSWPTSRPDGSTPRLEGHTGPVEAAGRIASDWRHALSLGDDGTLRVWDLVRSRQRGRVEVPGRASVLDVADGSRLALTGGEDGVARLWLIPLAPGEAGDPMPIDILSPDPRPIRPVEFLKPLLEDESADDHPARGGVR